MNIQQRVADEILEKLESIDADCVLAGGAPRDWKLGRLASDLDFYFRAIPLALITPVDVENMLNGIGMNVEIRKTQTEVEYDKNPHLFCVYDATYKDMKVQFMWIGLSPIDMVNEFAMDICQAYYKDGKIYTTKEFDISIEKRIIRITNPLYSNADAYIQKIINKFPEFTFVGYSQ